jgi:hypothetical protein
VANDGEGLTTWLARRERVKLTAKNGNGMGTPLSIAAQMWPTPNVPNGGRVVPKDANWTTLRTAYKADGKKIQVGLESAARKTSQDSGNQSDALSGRSTPPTLLNPEWVEWLMGFPIGWTDLEDSETL